MFQRPSKAVKLPNNHNFNGSTTAIFQQFISKWRSEFRLHRGGGPGTHLPPPDKITSTPRHEAYNCRRTERNKTTFLNPFEKRRSGGLPTRLKTPVYSEKPLYRPIPAPRVGIPSSPLGSSIKIEIGGPWRYVRSCDLAHPEGYTDGLGHTAVLARFLLVRFPALTTRGR